MNRSINEKYIKNIGRLIALLLCIGVFLGGCSLNEAIAGEMGSDADEWVSVGDIKSNAPFNPTGEANDIFEKTETPAAQTMSDVRDDATTKVTPTATPTAAPPSASPVAEGTSAPQISLFGVIPVVITDVHISGGVATVDTTAGDNYNISFDSSILSSFTTLNITGSGEVISINYTNAGALAGGINTSVNTNVGSTTVPITANGNINITGTTSGTISIGTNNVTIDSGNKVDGSGTVTLANAGTVDVLGSVNIISGGNLTITGTTTGIVTANTGDTVTLPTAGVWNVAGIGTINIGTSAATINATSTGTLNITGSTSGAGVINATAGTIKLPSTGNFNITGLGTFDLSGTNGTITLAGNTNIKGGTNAITGTINAPTPHVATITDNGSYRIKGNINVGTLNPTVIATDNVKVTGAKATIKATGNHELDLSGMASLVANDGDIIVDMATHSAKIKLPDSYSKSITILGAPATIPVHLPAGGGTINLEINTPSNVTLDIFDGNATGAVITSTGITNLTIKSTTGKTIAGTIDVTGAVALANLTVENTTGAIVVDVKGSDGGVSPFTKLTVNGALNDLKVTVAGGGAGIQNPTGNRNYTTVGMEKVIPNFASLTTNAISLTNLDLTGCGIETNFTLTHSGTVAIENLKLGGNGFTNKIFASWVNSNVTGLKTIDLSSCPSSYVKWTNAAQSNPAKVGTSIELKTNELDTTSALTKIDLGNSSYVGTLTMDSATNLATAVATSSHSGLTINISNDTTITHTITNAVHTLNLEKNEYSTWPDNRLVFRASPPNEAGVVNNTLKIFETNTTPVLPATLNFQATATQNTTNIIVQQKINGNIPIIQLGNGTDNLTYDDKGTTTTELTIKGIGSGSSSLKTVNVAGNSTGTDMVKLTYKDIALNTAPGGTDTLPTGGLPKVEGWSNNLANKELILDTISLTHLGTFYGENTTSGKYLSTRGYTNLKILDVGANILTNLNIRDQAATIHTLKFTDKSALVTYNLNDCSLLVNGTAALTEVFNVYGSSVATSGGVLTHVDYSGCTQLAENSVLSGDTLQLHNNAITVAYMDIAATAGIRNINLSGNELATATSVEFTGSIGASGGSTGLCLGKTTTFNNLNSVLNISSNKFNKVDFQRDLKVVNIAISQGNVATGTITNGVTVTDQTVLENINLSSNTVSTILDLSQNPNLKNLWGTTNNYETYPAATDMATGTPNNMATSTVDSLNIHGELNLENSFNLYGMDGTVRSLEFNNVSGKNEHEITIANLNKTSAENVQINYNGTLTTLILTERVGAAGAPPIAPVSNLEVVGNVIETVYTGTGTTGLMLPSDKTKLSDHVRIDTNPLDSVVIDGYNDVTFVGLSNTIAPIGAVPPIVAQGTPAGNIKHRISGGVTIINIANLQIVDITSNEIFKLNLSNNAILNSILGTLSVPSGGASIPALGATDALNGATALPVPNTAGVKDASMVDEEINLSKSANLNDKMIFNGHHIKKAYLSENDFELVDLRRNDGKGESASENDSPSYRDKNDEFRGILEFVDISNNTAGKEIGDLFLDENKLKIIDSTATAEAGTSVLMVNTKFKATSYLTANKNDIEKVVIKPGNGTNVESSVKEIQLNDNNMKILHAIDMKVLELIKVNRTVYGKNDFVDGSVILKGSDKLKEFAPATVVEEDKAVNDNISRRRPSRPNESYWNIDRAFSDTGVNFTLTHIPLDSFADLGGTANKPIAVKYKDTFAPAVNNTGYYHYVPVAELDITGCTNLVTLRVAGNYLTDGRMNLGGTTTPNIEFLDISGKHDITENSENGKYMVPGERMTQEDYLYGSLFASSGYRDGKSGQLGKSAGAFVSQWPKAEHIRIENNSYSGFNVAASAGTVKTVLAFNNNMTSVEVSAASQLQVLDVERNAIAPTIVLPTQNLLILRAGHNLISDYPNTHLVPGLQELYLDNNNFPEKSISRATTGNPNLKVINLSNNRFRAFEDFTSNLKLEEIYLFNNDTANLPKVALNGNVKVLDVHQNKIENIRDDELPNSLRYFDISDNKLQKFILTKIPAGMASMDNIITAHEVIPSHMSDPSMPYFHGDRRGFIGTLNISNNQLSYITDEYDVAWAAFDASSPTSVMRFLLDYNLLDIDKYDKSKPEYLKGRQKWLTSTKEGCIKFILTVTPEDRRVRLVRYLAYGHPLRGTSEKAPGNATYDIWFDNEIEYGPHYIEQSNRNIHQTIEYINMYAAVSTPDTRPKYPMRYGSDISSIINSSEQKNAVTPGKYADKNVARNNVAVVKACLYGPNTDLLPWEDVFGSKFKGTTDGKDATLSDGRYNPVTGPKN